VEVFSSERQFAEKKKKNSWGQMDALVPRRMAVATFRRATILAVVVFFKSRLKLI